LNIYELHEHYFEYMNDLGRGKPAGNAARQSKARQCAKAKQAAWEQGYNRQLICVLNKSIMVSVK